jgi:hypothetical protein
MLGSSVQWSNLMWWILHCTVDVKYVHFRKVSHFIVRGFKCYPSLLHNIYILCEKLPSWELKVNVCNIQFTVNNKYLFETNNEIHTHRRRCNNNLHLPIVNISKFNKGAYVSGVKVFNHLRQYIKALANDWKCF